MVKLSPLFVRLLVLSLLLLAVPFALQAPPAAAQNCDANYDPCIPFQGNNALNCDDISVAVRVIGSDHNRFDRDGNGTGCEDNGTPPAPRAQPTVAPQPQQAEQAPQVSQPLAATTTAAPAAVAAAPAASTPVCDPAYRPCVPYTTGDALNCNQIGGTVTVVGNDHNRFDRDGDGIGCEEDDRAGTSASAADATTAAPIVPAAAATPMLANTGVGVSNAMTGLWLVGFGSALLGLMHNARTRRRR